MPFLEKRPSSLAWGLYQHPSRGGSAIATSAPDGWWRADDVTLSGPDATVIDDLSGNGNDFVAVNAAAHNTGGQGGKAFLDFVAASTEHYQAGDVLDPASGDLTVLSIASPDAGNGHILTKWSGTDGWFTFLNATPLLQCRADGVTAAITDSETAALSTVQAFGMKHLFGTSVTALVDGTGTATTGTTGAVGNADQITLGARSDASVTFFDGKWYQSIVWLRALTAQEISDITAELNDYYSMSWTSVL